MAEKISRRRLAHYVADQIMAGQSVDIVMPQVAAYLVESRRLRETDLVIRAIEDEFAARGHIIARVTAARPLDSVLRQAIESLVGGHVYIDETVDSSVVGGIKVETPTAILDATIKRKLLALRQAKI